MKTENIPASAFRFDATVSSIKKTDQTSNEAEISLLARSSQPIEHWFWGRIVHDMEGYSAKDKICLDYCHDENQIIGYSDIQDVGKEGLTLAGKLVSVIEGDRADIVIRQGAAGIPFEASIFFDEAVLEWIPENTTTEVNGFQFAGPGVIAREWRLRGCAVCPYGADGNTESQLADSSAFHFSWRGKPMPRKNSAEKLTAAHADQLEETKVEANAETNTEATASTETKEGGDESTPAEATETQVEEASQLSSDPRCELKRFMNRFGDADGAKFFADGLDWSTAQDKFIDKLCAERDAATKRAEDAESKLKQIGETVGEKEPHKSGAFSTQKPTAAKSISEAKKMASTN